MHNEGLLGWLITTLIVLVLFVTGIVAKIRSEPLQIEPGNPFLEVRKQPSTPLPSTADPRLQIVSIERINPGNPFMEFTEEAKERSESSRSYAHIWKVTDEEGYFYFVEARTKPDAREMFEFMSALGAGRPLRERHGKLFRNMFDVVDDGPGPDHGSAANRTDPQRNTSPW